MSQYGQNNSTKKATGWNVKESVVRPDMNPQGRIDLDPSKFDALIAQKGVIAKVYRTLYCPNVKSVDGAEHEIDCEICNGSGFLDVDPICVPVFIQSQELHELPNIEGLVDGNTIQVTFPIGVEVQYFTKIVLHDFTTVFPQRVLRKKGSLTDVLKYPACRVNVLVQHSNGSLVQYYQDMDFAIDNNGNIKWLTPGDQQLLAFSAVPDSGTFTITQNGHTTASIPFNANAAAVQVALRAMTGYEDVMVSGDFTAGFLVTWIGIDSPVSLATTTSALLNGVTAVTIHTTDRSKKARKPNDNRPYSIHYAALTQYRARAAIHANRFTQFATGNQVQQVKMQEQWYCTKEFLVKRTDKFTNVELEQGPYDQSPHKIVVEDGGTEGN